MMYPPFTKVRYEELHEVFRNKRVLGAFTGAELGCRGRLLMFVLAIDLRGYPEGHGRSHHDRFACCIADGHRLE